MVKLTDLRACKQCHMVYFKTPSEKCGIKIEGNNKWITLIQKAQLSK